MYADYNAADNVVTLSALEVHTMISSFLITSVFEMEQPVLNSVSPIGEPGVEIFMVCITVMDDVISCVFHEQSPH